MCSYRYLELDDTSLQAAAVTTAMYFRCESTWPFSRQSTRRNTGFFVLAVQCWDLGMLQVANIIASRQENTAHQWLQDSPLGIPHATSSERSRHARVCCSDLYTLISTRLIALGSANFGDSSLAIEPMFPASRIFAKAVRRRYALQRHRRCVTGLSALELRVQGCRSRQDGND